MQQAHWHGVCMREGEKGGYGRFGQMLPSIAGKCLGSLVERRKSILKHLKKDLKPLAEAEFQDRGAVRDLLQKRDCLTRIDLKDAF